MKRLVVLQLLVTAVCAGVGGYVAVSVSGGTVDANPGRMNDAVPMMTEAQLRVGGSSVSSDLATTTISPVRILDTRANAAALGGTKVPWGPKETRTVQAAGLGVIPEDAAGVVVNVTVLNASSSTYLTLFPTGGVMPTASTINPKPDEVAFNAATVLLGDGSFDIYNARGEVDVIVDVTAYMTRTLADDVGRLQVGEILSPQKQPEYQYMDSGDYDSTTITNYSEWRGVVAWSDEMSEFRGVKVASGRYSDSAKIRYEASVVNLDDFETVCFRIVSSIDGPLEGTESCTTGSGVEPTHSVQFYNGDSDPTTPPEAGEQSEYFVIEGPLGSMGSGTLYLQAKVSTTEQCSNFYSQRINCEVVFDNYQLRVFDN